MFSFLSKFIIKFSHRTVLNQYKMLLFVTSWIKINFIKLTRAIINLIFIIPIMKLNNTLIL